MTLTKAEKTSKEVYGPRTTKRSTRAEMELRRTTLLEIASEAQPASVRHIYYRAVVAGLVEKKETGYRKVQRELLRLRRDGLLPFSWIVDESRRAHWPQVYLSPTSALNALAGSYRRNPWQQAGAPNVEIWCESESIAGSLMPLKAQYAVPIFPIKGQTSESFVWNAATAYKGNGRVNHVLYAGDYDPAGLQIGAQLEGKLREYSAPGVEIVFTRVTITHDQAPALQALGTPPKQAHWLTYAEERQEFVGLAIEAEAIDARALRGLFANAIENIALDEVGYDIFDHNQLIEAMDRDRLAVIAERVAEGGDGLP